MEGSDGAILTREGDVRRRARTCTSTRTSTTTRATGASHYDTTAPEIIEQTGGRLTHFVAGLGTSGTFVGRRPAAARVQSVDPADLGSARFAAARPRRPEAHGDGDRAGHLRPGARRRRPRRQHRGSVRADAAAGAGTGCSSASRAARISPARCAWRAQHVGRGDRRGVLRRRREVPVRALLGRDRRGGAR